MYFYKSTTSFACVYVTPSRVYSDGVDGQGPLDGNRDTGIVGTSGVHPSQRRCYTGSPGGEGRNGEGLYKIPTTITTIVILIRVRVIVSGVIDSGILHGP